jgi:bifunctional non-homologous end joining protein LigD
VTATRSQFRIPKLLTPALATRVADVPAGTDWMHESKLDGYRIQCHVSGGVATLLTRNGLDWTARFPVIQKEAQLVAADRTLIIDGEVVMPAAKGSSPFQALQRAVTEHMTARALYWVFDLLWYDDMDLRRLPLLERRRALRTMLAGAPSQRHIRITREKKGAPDSLLATACARGDEGIISKRRSAPYHAGRSTDWLKIKCGQQDEFVVIGFTPPRGSRKNIGALLLATRPRANGVLEYAGRVGSGMDDQMLRGLHDRLRAVSTRPAGVTSRAPFPRVVQWVDPTLVINVNFAEWTSDGLLRQGTFAGIREDRSMKSVTRERIASAATVTLTHANRVVYAESGVRKMDIAAYVDAVAPLMLPHISGRPLSVLRCPSGADAACFFQKHWTAAQGHQVTTRDIAEADGTTDPYAVATNAGDLAALVQSNALEIHMWGAKFPAIEKPDRIIFDLDPDPTVSWNDVCDAARAVRELLGAAGLASWVKLSGGKGLHVTVPISGAMTWDQASTFSKLVATRMAAEAPQRFTSAMAKSARKGRIFIDWMRNTRGATAVAPWSLRARAGAPIAMPLLWEELDGIPRGDLMSIGDVMDYLRSGPADPWKLMLEVKQRLTAAVVSSLGGRTE